MVIFMVNATPVLSDAMLVSTSEAGSWVGKGPAVSDGEEAQLPEVVVAVGSFALLQDSNTGIRSPGDAKFFQEFIPFHS